MRKIKYLLVFSILLLVVTSTWAEVLVVSANKTTIGGYTRLRYLLLPEEADTFRFDELSLTLRNDFTPNVYGMLGTLIYGGNAFYLEHAFLGVKNLPLSGTLMIGQTRNYAFGLVPAYANRKTTNYGIVSDVFTHDRILGIQYLGKIKVVDFGVAIHNGYSLGIRFAGEGVNRVNFMADRDSTLGAFQGRDASDNKEISARFSIVDVLPGFSYGVSGSMGRLSIADLTFVRNNFNGNYNSKKKVRIGLDAKYTQGPFLVQLETYEGKTSELTHTAWQLLGQYKWAYTKDKNMDFYARYGEVDPDTNATNSSYTWKLTQTVLGCVYYFTKSIWLQTELEFNGENPPSGVEEVKNDAIFTELFVSF